MTIIVYALTSNNKTIVKNALTSNKEYVRLY